MVHRPLGRQAAGRLNCIAHLLKLIPYKEVPRDKVKLPKRSDKGEYDDQATLKGRTFVPEEVLSTLAREEQPCPAAR